jgi:glycosyltransferase involved in cell wall biosynthesis
VNVEDRVLLVVDNFRVGGLERLALDQLYILKDLGIQAEARYRQVEVTKNLPNFLELEEKRIREKNIEIIGLPEGDLSQLGHFVRLFRKNSFTLIINHSVGAAVILRMAILLTRKNINLKTFIHQLPTLSAPIQRYKRFIYSLFSHQTYGYSAAVTKDWNSRVQGKWFLPSFLRKKMTIQTLRNGIYLDRLPKLKPASPGKTNNKRLVFIGRNVGWKNLDKIFNLLRERELAEFSALVIVPMVNPEQLERAEKEFSSRINFEIGKKIEDIEFGIGDIHVYPVDYGSNAKFVESISLNCLEMACLGIPSLIAVNGSETWADLVEQGHFYEVDWNSKDDVAKAVKALSYHTSQERFIEEARRTVSIENNITEILASL